MARAYRYMTAQDRIDSGENPVKAIVGGIAGSIGNMLLSDRTGKIYDLTPQEQTSQFSSKVAKDIGGQIGKPAGSFPILPAVNFSTGNRATDILPRANAAVPPLQTMAAHTPGQQIIPLKKIQPIAEAPVKTARQLMVAASAPAKAATSSPAIQPIGAQMGPPSPETASSGYAEYAGDPTTRINAGPPDKPEQPAPAVQPIFAQAQPVTTYGDSSGVYQLAPGQNPPPNLDYGNMSMAELLTARGRQRDVMRNSQLALNDAQIGHLQTSDTISAAKAPMEIRRIAADTDYKNTATERTKTLLPVEVLKGIADADESRAKATLAPKLAESTITLQGAQARNYDAESKLHEAQASPEWQQAAHRKAQADAEAKDFKDLTKTYYNSIKDLNLPKGFEGQYMEIAKDLAAADDPNSDFGIYYTPGQNRQGIATKRSIYEPLLNKYRSTGYPEADAYAAATADLQKLEKTQGVKLSKPFPNLDRLPKNSRKPVDEMGV